MDIPQATDVKQILVVEGHPVARKGIVYLLTREPDLAVCGETDNLVDAKRLLETNSPDLAILDLGLADGNGLELLRRASEERPDLPILVLSSHSEAFYAERALRAGAKGYITKAEDCEHIIQAVRTVLAGRVYVNNELANQMLSVMVQGTAKSGSFPINTLTDREFEIFELIGNGMQTREIAQRLHISVGTVDAHREHIKKKLKIDSAGKLMVRAIRWIQSGDHE